MKKAITVILAAALCLCVFAACGKTVKISDIKGYWRSEVTGAEYLAIYDDSTCALYNSSMDMYYSGNLVLDGQYLVIDGTSRKDENAFMIIKYVY